MSEEKITKKAKPKDPQTHHRLVLVRIRGINRMNSKISDTLDMMGLHRKNYCVIVEDTPSIKGMIIKAKDYITWGEVDADTEKLLIDKKQEMKINFQGKKVPKKFFRLCPPRGGFERKGIKVHYSKGGALGNREKDINELIKRMI